MNDISPKTLDVSKFEPLEILQKLLERIEKTMGTIEKSRNPKEKMLYKSLVEIRKIITREINIARDKLDRHLKPEG